MNTKRAPMDDVNFRRAMSCMFDYDTICKNIFIDSVKSTGPVASGVAGHVDTAAFSFDIEKAKQYLAASQYADNYQEQKIEMLVNSDVADLEKIALMFQASAKQLGITVEINKAPWVSIIDRVGAPDTTPHMLSINSAPSYNEAGTYLELRYHSKNQGNWEQGEWLGDSKLDGMIEDSLATVDQKERFDKYAKIQNYIVDQLCPTIYICDLTERIAYHSDAINWPAMKATTGEIPKALYGFVHIISEIELNR
jgi:peptide/nickel transport system substrate-binding protein